MTAPQSTQSIEGASSAAGPAGAAIASSAATSMPMPYPSGSGTAPVSSILPWSVSTSYAL
eukprot:m.50331 g.50331  ORF g.50331 m.50331 type:complete len:60 (+) comp7230_c0_seq1:1614-1793(+)